MGSIVGALIGRHLAHEEEKRQNAQQLALAPVASYLKDPVNSPYTPEDVQAALQMGMQLNIFNKDHGKVIQAQLDRATEQRRAGEALKSLQQATGGGQQGQGGAGGGSNLGVPKLPGAEASPVPPSQRQAAGLPPAGLPKPPFEQGAQAGPAPEQSGPAPQQGNPVAQMKIDSQAGGTGFGGPSSLPPPPGFKPAWEASRTPLDMGRIKGQTEGGKVMGRYDTLNQGLGANPDVQDLSSRQRLSLMTGEPITPDAHFAIPGTHFSKAGDVDINGSPVPEGTRGRYYNMYGRVIFEAEAGSLSFKEVIDPATGNKTYVPVDRYTGQTQNQNPDLVSAPRLVFKTITFDDGSTLPVGVNPYTGQAQSADPRLRGVNPAMLATQHTSFKLVRKPNGDAELVPVTTGTQKVGAPGMAPPPQMTPPPQPGPNSSAQPVYDPFIQGPDYNPAQQPPPVVTPAPSPGQTGVPQAGGTVPTQPARRGGPVASIGQGTVVGGTPMTPGQKIKMEQQSKQLNNAIGTIKLLADNTELLNNMWSTGKIMLQTDPTQKWYMGIVNKNMPMTEQEKRVAAGWQKMTEAIMLMRLPMGAAGYSGAESFHALQSNKGIVTQDPGILKRMLDNALREFKGQRDPMLAAGTKYGFHNDPEYDKDFDLRPENQAAPAPGATPAGNLAAPPLPQQLSASDVGKVFQRADGKKIKITAVNPANNTQYKSEEVK